MTTQLLSVPAQRRGTNPLHPDRVLRTAVDLGRETMRANAADPRDFDGGLARTETAVARFRSAFLTQLSAAADAALAYHDNARADLEADFSPLYYRRAVMENVLVRYERTAMELLRQLA